MFSHNACDLQAGIFCVFHCAGQEAHYFLRRVEGCTVAGYGVVPTPLTLAQVREYLFHFSFSSALIPSKLRFDVGISQLLLNALAEVVNLLLALINILTQGLCILTVASLTSAVNVSQRTHNMVIRVFDAAFRDIRHMAVGTRDAALAVDTLHKEFVARVLCFQDLSF